MATPGFSQWRGITKVLTSKTGTAVMTAEAAKAYNRQSHINEITRRNLQQTARFQVERLKYEHVTDVLGKQSAKIAHVKPTNQLPAVKFNKNVGSCVDRFDSDSIMTEPSRLISKSKTETDSIGVVITTDVILQRDSVP